MGRFALATRGSRNRDSMQALRNRRALHLLLATGVITLSLGLGWGFFFALKGVWWVAASEFILAALGLAVIVSVRRRHARLSAWMAFVGLFLIVCLFSAFIDLPTPGIPRSSHLFLLVIAACAHYVCRGEPAWLRYGAVGAFLLAFIVFAAMPGGSPNAYLIDDGIRRVGIWINLSSVAISLALVLHLQESDSLAHGALHRSLRDALVGRRFTLFYQPQIDADGNIVGAEALLRWNDQKRGIVHPRKFLQAAEETGFILPLGQWVLSAACEQLGKWKHDPALADLRLSVNVSALQVQQSEFVPQVLDTLQRTGADGERLTLELTESMLLHNKDAAAAKMQALHEGGVRLSLDDFGTGYSSLSYLRQMPFSELKIDRAFVAEIDRDPQAASITRNLLQLGHDLGIDVVAEGIEQPAQHEFLRAQGCALFQGYLFGRPMGIEAFENLVFANRAQVRRGVDASPRTTGSPVGRIPAP